LDSGLAGRRVQVAGSGSGTVKATKKAFLQEGARVLVHGLRDNEVNACVEDRSSLGDVTGLAADLINSASADALCQFALEGYNIDVLINNVGTLSVKKFEDLTDDDWLHFFNVNVINAVRMSRAPVPTMLQRASGAIVNLASEAGVKPLPQMVHYSVTKTVMPGLTRGMAELTKGTEVCVNSVLPGPTWAEGVKSCFDGLAIEKAEPLDDIIQNYFLVDELTPLIRRFVKTDEVARTIVTVAANEAANGAAYQVEGGIVRSILYLIPIGDFNGCTDIFAYRHNRSRP